MALNKSAGYCERKLFPNKMVDGIKTLTNFESYSLPCKSKSFVKILLGGRNYVVHYVVVFEGEGGNNALLT